MVKQVKSATFHPDFLHFSVRKVRPSKLTRAVPPNNIFHSCLKSYNYAPVSTYFNNCHLPYFAIVLLYDNVTYLYNTSFLKSLSY